jgi:hypothetical protein
MERNRERMLAMGLPALMRTIENIAGPAPKAPPKKRVKKEKKPAPVKVKSEPGEEEAEEEEGGLRRSRRNRNVVKKEKEETAEERFEREVGEFIVDGECPKCGNILEKGHRSHLRSCGGPKARAGDGSTKGYSLLDKELLSELTEEERKDSKKRMMARMKALAISNLVDFTPEAATFIVLGSKGTPYTVTLADEKHKCTCLDHRFRRHNCKHICLCLDQVGALEDPSTWKGAVECSLDDLIKMEDGAGGSGPAVAPVPKDKNAEMASKFL